MKLRILLGVFFLHSFTLGGAHAARLSPFGTEMIAGYGVQGGAGALLEVRSREAIVKFSPGATSAQRSTTIQGFGGKVIEELDGTGWTHIELPPGSVLSGMQLIQNGAGVLNVQPNRIFRMNRVPSDPLAMMQYHLGKVNAFAGWEYETGTSSRVTIVIADAGIEGTHPDLQAKFANTTSRDCTGACADNNPPTPACNHGTRVAGVAAAVTNNGAQIAGISWGAQLMSVKIFPDAGCAAGCNAGGCITDETTIIRAITDIIPLQNTAATGKLVLNLSIGAQFDCGFEDGAMQGTIDNAVNAGIVVIAAAGNSGNSTNVNAPGNCDNVMPVGATDANDALADFSATGPAMAARGVVAPGESITTTDIGGGITGSARGTSFSAPLVSGLAALILSAKPDLAPAATLSQAVRNNIRNSVEGIGLSGQSVPSGFSLQGNSVGAGRVNVFRAMKLTVEGTLAGFKGDEESIAFPNPFRPSTHGTTTITIPPAIAGQKPSVKVYTIDGQLVRDLEGNTTWDGKNDSRVSVATGVYVFVVKTTNGMNRGRVALIR